MDNDRDLNIKVNLDTNDANQQVKALENTIAELYRQIEALKAQVSKAIAPTQNPDTGKWVFPKANTSAQDRQIAELRARVATLEAEKTQLRPPQQGNQGAPALSHYDNIPKGSIPPTQVDTRFASMPANVQDVFSADKMGPMPKFFDVIAKATAARRTQMDVARSQLMALKKETVFERKKIEKDWYEYLHEAENEEEYYKKLMTTLPSGKGDVADHPNLTKNWGLAFGQFVTDIRNSRKSYKPMNFTGSETTAGHISTIPREVREAIPTLFDIKGNLPGDMSSAKEFDVMAQSVTKVLTRGLKAEPNNNALRIEASKVLNLISLIRKFGIFPDTAGIPGSAQAGVTLALPRSAMNVLAELGRSPIGERPMQIMAGKSPSKNWQGVTDDLERLQAEGLVTAVLPKLAGGPIEDMMSPSSRVRSDLNNATAKYWKATDKGMAWLKQAGIFDLPGYAPIQFDNSLLQTADDNQLDVNAQPITFWFKKKMNEVKVAFRKKQRIIQGEAFYDMSDTLKERIGMVMEDIGRVQAGKTPEYFSEARLRDIFGKLKDNGLIDKAGGLDWDKFMKGMASTTMIRIANARQNDSFNRANPNQIDESQDWLKNAPNADMRARDYAPGAEGLNMFMNDALQFYGQKRLYRNVPSRDMAMQHVKNIVSILKADEAGQKQFGEDYTPLSDREDNALVNGLQRLWIAGTPMISRMGKHVGPRTQEELVAEQQSAIQALAGFDIFGYMKRRAMRASAKMETRDVFNKEGGSDINVFDKIKDIIQEKGFVTLTGERNSYMDPTTGQLVTRPRITIEDVNAAVKEAEANYDQYYIRSRSKRPKKPFDKEQAAMAFLRKMIGAAPKINQAGEISTRGVTLKGSGFSKYGGLGLDRTSYDALRHADSEENELTKATFTKYDWSKYIEVPEGLAGMNDAQLAAVEANAAKHYGRNWEIAQNMQGDLLPGFLPVTEHQDVGFMENGRKRHLPQYLEGYTRDAKNKIHIPVSHGMALIRDEFKGLSKAQQVAAKLKAARELSQGGKGMARGWLAWLNYMRNETKSLRGRHTITGEETTEQTDVISDMAPGLEDVMIRNPEAVYPEADAPDGKVGLFQHEGLFKRSFSHIGKIALANRNASKKLRWMSAERILAGTGQAQNMFSRWNLPNQDDIARFASSEALAAEDPRNIGALDMRRPYKKGLNDEAMMSLTIPGLHLVGPLAAGLSAAAGKLKHAAFPHAGAGGGIPNESTGRVTMLFPASSGTNAQAALKDLQAAYPEGQFEVITTMDSKPGSTQSGSIIIKGVAQKKPLYDQTGQNYHFTQGWEDEQTKVATIGSNRGAGTTLMQGIEGYKTATEQGHNWLDKMLTKGGSLGKLSWYFASLSMSSMGVFFSLRSIVTMIQQGLNMIFAPLKNVEGLLESYAFAQSRVSDTGIDMNDMLAGFGLTMADLVEGSFRLKSVTDILSTAFGALAAKVLLNPENWTHIMNIVKKIVAFLMDPAISKAIGDIFAKLDEMMPSILDTLTTAIGLVRDFVIPMAPWIMWAFLVSQMIQPLTSAASFAANIGKSLLTGINLAYKGFVVFWDAIPVGAQTAGMLSGGAFAFAFVVGAAAGLVGVWILFQLGAFDALKNLGEAFRTAFSNIRDDVLVLLGAILVPLGLLGTAMLDIFNGAGVDQIGKDLSAVLEQWQNASIRVRQGADSEAGKAATERDNAIWGGAAKKVTSSSAYDPYKDQNYLNWLKNNGFDQDGNLISTPSTKASAKSVNVPSKGNLSPAPTATAQKFLSGAATTQQKTLAEDKGFEMPKLDATFGLTAFSTVSGGMTAWDFLKNRAGGLFKRAPDAIKYGSSAADLDAIAAAESITTKLGKQAVPTAEGAFTSPVVTSTEQAMKTSTWQTVKETVSKVVASVFGRVPAQVTAEAAVGFKSTTMGSTGMMIDPDMFVLPNGEDINTRYYRAMGRPEEAEEQRKANVAKKERRWAGGLLPNLSDTTLGQGVGALLAFDLPRDGRLKSADNTTGNLGESGIKNAIMESNPKGILTNIAEILLSMKNNGTLSTVSIGGAGVPTAPNLYPTKTKVTPGVISSNLGKGGTTIGGLPIDWTKPNGGIDGNTRLKDTTVPGAIGYDTEGRPHSQTLWDIDPNTGKNVWAGVGSTIGWEGYTTTDSNGNTIVSSPNNQKNTNPSVGPPSVAYPTNPMSHVGTLNNSWMQTDDGKWFYTDATGTTSEVGGKGQKPTPNTPEGRPAEGKDLSYYTNPASPGYDRMVTGIKNGVPTYGNSADSIFKNWTGVSTAWDQGSIPSGQKEHDDMIKAQSGQAGSGETNYGDWGGPRVAQTAGPDYATYVKSLRDAEAAGVDLNALTNMSDYTSTGVFDLKKYQDDVKKKVAESPVVAVNAAPKISPQTGINLAYGYNTQVPVTQKDGSIRYETQHVAGTLDSVSKPTPPPAPDRKYNPIGETNASNMAQYLTGGQNLPSSLWKVMSGADLEAVYDEGFRVKSGGPDTTGIISKMLKKYDTNIKAQDTYQIQANQSYVSGLQKLVDAGVITQDQFTKSTAGMDIAGIASSNVTGDVLNTRSSSNVENAVSSSISKEGAKTYNISVVVNGNASQAVTDDMIRKIKRELFGAGV
jgi:hypothetical protein